MASNPYSSPFDFGMNNQSFILPTGHVSSQRLEPFPVNNVTFADVTKNNSAAIPTPALPPSYESICNGTSRSIVINNQSSVQSSSPQMRNNHHAPPPGLVHPSEVSKKIINTTVLQALRSEIGEVKTQLANISVISQKIDNLEKLLNILEKFQ